MFLDKLDILSCTYFILAVRNEAANIICVLFHAKSAAPKRTQMTFYVLFVSSSVPQRWHGKGSFCCIYEVKLLQIWIDGCQSRLNQCPSISWVQNCEKVHFAVMAGKGILSCHCCEGQIFKFRLLSKLWFEELIPLANSMKILLTYCIGSF